MSLRLPSPKQMLVDATKAVEDMVETAMSPLEQLTAQMGLPIPKPPRISEALQQLPDLPLPGGGGGAAAASAPITPPAIKPQRTGGEVLSVAEGNRTKKTTHLSGVVNEALVV